MNTQNYMPTQAQFQTVIDNFKRADEMAGGAEVDMICGGIDPQCGSPMCHAGWYVVASYERAKSLGNLGHYVLRYNTGAAMIGQDLGFGHDGIINADLKLELWAASNPEIWGNIYGSSMFLSGRAFNNFDGTLKSIISHWEGVKERARVLGVSV